MRVAIFGSSGFIGTHLIEFITQFPGEISKLILFKHDSDLTKLETPADTLSELKIVQANIFEPQSYARELDNVDVVVNLVGKFSEDEKTATRYNVEASQKLLSAMEHSGCKYVVFTSSMAVYGDTPEAIKESAKPSPQNTYGRTKLEGEGEYRKHHEKGINSIILRMPHVYGPRKSSGIVYNTLSGILKGNPISITGDGSQTRDFIFVQDVVQAILRSITYLDNMDIHAPDNIFNICYGKAYSINELVKICENITGKKAQLNFIESKSSEILHLVGDNTKAHERLGFKPAYSLEKGLKETNEWINKNEDVKE